MILTNTSRYPQAEVEKIVAFAFSDIPDANVAIHVKGSKYGIAGRAYPAIPRMSPSHGKAEMLVVARIGPESKFPKDNMVESRRWVRVKAGELSDSSTTRFVQSSAGDYRERLVISKHPYGGKNSPLITMNTWREGLVALLSHEARHIYQFMNTKKLSEVDAESYASTRLNEWRTTNQEVSR